jgi:organic anion transporter 5A
MRQWAIYVSLFYGPNLNEILGNKSLQTLTDTLRVDREMNGWLGGWMGGWMEGWMGGWMDGWMDGWTIGRRDEWLDRTRHSLGR